MKRFRNRSTRVAEIISELSDFELVKDGFATIEEAYEYLACGRSKLNELLREGELVSTLIGKHRVICVRSLHIFAAAHIERKGRAA